MSAENTMMFSDLTFSMNGLQFQLTTVTEETVYRVNAGGYRGAVKKNLNGTSVFRYELAFRQSLQQMTGLMYGLSSTVAGHTMEAIAYGIYDVELSDEKLKWKEVQLLYRDSPRGDGFRSVAFDADVSFYIDNGCLQFSYIPIHSDVDVRTLEKSALWISIRHSLPKGSD